MSPSAFHQHFRTVTSLSPLQFQKHLRLIEARRLMLTEGERSSSAAFAVGYESVSQFTREYGRMFGLPPIKDAKAARQKALAACSCEDGGGVECQFACSSPPRIVSFAPSLQSADAWFNRKGIGEGKSGSV